MNLIDATRSGRRFRRPGGNYTEGFYYMPDGHMYLLKEDILAEDYELEPVQEKTVTISKKDLERAWMKIFEGRFATEALCRRLSLDLGLNDDESGREVCIHGTHTKMPCRECERGPENV